LENVYWYIMWCMILNLKKLETVYWYTMMHDIESEKLENVYWYTKRCVILNFKNLKMYTDT